jgi:hypothetical protein
MRQVRMKLHLTRRSKRWKPKLRSPARFFNHRWDIPETMVKIGRIEEDEIEQISGGLFREEIDILLNRAVYDYDLVLILGPVLPHEVVGFSGGKDPRGPRHLDSGGKMQGSQSRISESTGNPGGRVHEQGGGRSSFRGSCGRDPSSAGAREIFELK